MRNSGTNGLAVVVVTKNNEGPAKQSKTPELGQPIFVKKNPPLANVGAKLNINFDYAFAAGGFYVYEYWGDGEFFIRFATNDSELISVITNNIDNGIRTGSTSFDSLLEEIQSGEGSYPTNIIDAVKKRRWDKGFSMSLQGKATPNPRGVSQVSPRDNGGVTGRGTSGDTDGFKDKNIIYRTASEEARQRVISAQAQTLSTAEIEEYANEVSSLSSKRDAKIIYIEKKLILFLHFFAENFAETNKVVTFAPQMLL